MKKIRIKTKAQFMRHLMNRLYVAEMNLLLTTHPIESEEAAQLGKDHDELFYKFKKLK